MTKTEPQVTLFTDGAARDNPGPGGWGAVILFGESRIVERGGYEAKTTNNRMELTAVLEALAFASGEQRTQNGQSFILYTDSRYVIKGATEWLEGWKARDWQTLKKEPVEHSALWHKLDELLQTVSVEWRHIHGHSGSQGNERADAIATQFADSQTADLFDGPRSDYPIAVEDVSYDATTRQQKKRRGGKAYSYVSAVDGVVETHATWRDTERRVKGVSGARYKKALSPDDEQAIIDEFSRS